jgi:hypothetical protein
MGGIYEARRSDGLRFHDIHTKFHKDRFGIQNLIEGEKWYTDTQREW